MINLRERMSPTSAGVEPATSWSPVRRRIQLSHRGRLKWKYFVLIDHIFSETICLFCFCGLFSNIYPKIKITAKIWSDLCNFHRKVDFWNYWLRKYFLLFFAEFELLMFHNVMKISEKLNKRNLLKTCLRYLPYRFLHNLHLFILWEKWQYLILLKTNDYNKKKCA